jgi:hypothetical protein
VKVLGVMALLGTGDETDWKVIVVDIKDPLAQIYNDASDVPMGRVRSTHHAKCLTVQILEIVEFFKFYKVPDGEEPSVFGFEEKLLNKTFAHTVIEDKHQEWKKLMKGAVDTSFHGRAFQTKCTLCPDPTIKKEFKVGDEEARAWAQTTVEEYLNKH